MSLLLSLPAIQGLAGDIVVRPTGASTVEARPGARLTLGFLVSNTGTADQPVWTSVSLPPRWRIVVADAPFTLVAGSSDVRLITLVIPPTASAGTYPILYTAAPAEDPLDSATATIEVRVPAMKQLDLEVAEAPRNAVAGSSFSIRYFVTNRGNSLELVRLRAASLLEGFQLSINPSTLRLAPQESREVLVNVETPPQGNMVYHCRIDLIAQVQSDTTIAPRASSTTRIIPSPTMVEARYRNIPGVARLRWGGEGDRSGPQFELAGSGSASADGSDRLEMLIRTPDLQQTTLLGYRDEYRLEYNSEKVQLYAGDRNYMLSPLTEYGRYAFGAGGSFRDGGISVTAFANRDRFLDSHPREAAGSVGVELNPHARVSVNYLHRQNDRTANIVTARGFFQDLWMTQGDVEVGRDISHGNDNALALHWWGRDQWGSFALQYIYAGPRYDAYYSNMDFKSASLTVVQAWPIRITANYRDDKRNLDLDTTLFTAPRSTYFDAGVGYKNSLTVEYRYNRYRDDLPGSTYARRLTSLLVQAGYNSAAVGVLGQFEFGTEHDDNRGSSSAYRRYGLISSFAPSMYQSYGLSLEYQRSVDPITGEPLDRLSGSLRAGLNLPGGTRMLAHFFSGRSLVNSSGSFTYLDLSVEQTLPFGHIIGARARHSATTPSTEPEALSYLFEYAIPFAIPLRFSSRASTIRGSFRDAVTGEPVAGVIVTLDHAAVLTNEDGEFLLPDVRTGSHILDIDPAAIPRGFITLPQLPLEITIVDGEPRDVAMTLVRGAGAFGVVMIDTASTDVNAVGATTIGGTPLSNLLLELTSGSRLHRRRTASDGRFEFQGLPPGQWQLRILPESIPPGYRISADTTTFILRPGDRQEIQLRARLVQRQIRMLEEGKILIDTTASPSAIAPVAPPPVQQPVPGAPSAIVVRTGEPPTYGVQISTWEDKEKASAQATLYSRALDVQVRVMPFTSKPGTTKYRIVAGPFATESEAEAFARRLREQ